MQSYSNNISSDPKMYVCIHTAGLAKCFGALIPISHSLYQFFLGGRSYGCPNKHKRKNGQNVSFIKCQAPSIIDSNFHLRFMETRGDYEVSL